jgi:DeoR/GlpR family transcriptional regulator of sugar metabolism
VIVVTTSLAALEELAGSASVQVRLTGKSTGSSDDLSGNSVAHVLAGVHADRVLCRGGCPFLQQGSNELRRGDVFLLSSGRRERALVIDSSKIGMETAYRLCAVKKCDMVITDKGIKAADLARPGFRNCSLVFGLHSGNLYLERARGSITEKL